MRIEAYNQVQSIYQAQKVNKAQKTAPASHVADRVSISSFGKDMATAKAAVKNAPDVRADVTAPIKAQIDAGTYSVSTESFAAKLMAKYQELG
ncbi:MAG: flagellar biosynthesis anti-sigma factor FlgM [Lachnospiraceae bacterium]|jgi:negative regulator of flagellin synthesis FlgM|nr:flagellar biosynthesis anti-sigma factor FlgM [Lachnospiraceae bacterium]MCR5426279.1 flagellar biosynthesis anti-sigma factor FlgM [Lachnospiraceae bacterium]